MRCTNCGRVTSLCRELWKNIHLCPCCISDIGATAMALEEKGFIFERKHPPTPHIIIDEEDGGE